MVKISVLRSLTLGSAVFFTALVLFSPGVLASTKLLQFEALDPLASSIDAEHLVELYQSVVKWKIIDIQIASACSYKHLTWFGGGFVEWEDKDCPCLNE